MPLDERRQGLIRIDRGSYFNYSPHRTRNIFKNTQYKVIRIKKRRNYINKRNCLKSFIYSLLKIYVVRVKEAAAFTFFSPVTHF